MTPARASSTTQNSQAGVREHTQELRHVAHRILRLLETNAATRRDMPQRRGEARCNSAARCDATAAMIDHHKSNCWMMTIFAARSAPQMVQRNEARILNSMLRISRRTSASFRLGNSIRLLDVFFACHLTPRTVPSACRNVYVPGRNNARANGKCELTN